ncbi:MAG: META domain-containing protein [Ferruginibacter sp.]
MKKFMLFAFVTCIILTACESTKNTTTASPATEVAALNGTWELNYITGPRIAFNGLYPNKKPTIIFDIANKRIGGNAGCNSYGGELNAQAGKIDFSGPLFSTQMACVEGMLGETTYLQMLKRVNAFNVTDTTLNFMAGNLVLMRFSKR